MGIFANLTPHSTVAHAADINQLRDIAVGVTSFPSSPTHGERCWRVDRGLEYYWNSGLSLWITTTLFTSSLAARPNTATPYPQGPAYFDFPIINYNINGAFIQKFQVWFDPTSVAQSGSNYYALSGVALKVSNGTPLGLTQVSGPADTQAFTTTNFVNDFTMGFNQAIDNTYHSILFQVTQNGSPGTFYVTAALGYRLIG